MGRENFFKIKWWSKKKFYPKRKFKKILVQKNFGFEKFVSLRQFWVQRKIDFEIFFGSNKLWALIKFCVLKKFCPRTFWSTKIMTPKKLGPKSLVKIGPVTAEILLIWTNVTRAYVARKNVTITVDIF